MHEVIKAVEGKLPQPYADRFATTVANDATHQYYKASGLVRGSLVIFDLSRAETLTAGNLNARHLPLKVSPTSCSDPWQPLLPVPSFSPSPL